MSLFHIPCELQLLLVSFLGSARTILRFSQCSVYCYTLVQNENIWERLCSANQWSPYKPMGHKESYMWYSLCDRIPNDKHCRSVYYYKALGPKNHISGMKKVSIFIARWGQKLKKLKKQRTKFTGQS